MPATPVRPPAYRRREPEKEPLYQILAGHPETFLQHTRTSEHRLPLHAEKEMRAYLECGILAYQPVENSEYSGNPDLCRMVGFLARVNGLLPLYGNGSKRITRKRQITGPSAENTVYAMGNGPQTR